MLTHLLIFKISVVKTVCLCNRHQAPAIYSMCLSQKIFFWLLSQTVCVCDRHSLSVRDRLFLSQTVDVRHRLLSATENLCLSENVCVCNRQYVFVTGSVCLSQTVCSCHIQSVFVKYSLCLSQKVFVCQSVSSSNTLLDQSWPDT